MPDTSNIQHNPIVVVDDDGDDIEMMREAFIELGLPNELLFFNSGDELVAYLEKATSSPYLIICDVNLPGQDGFAVRERVFENKRIRYKAVPFIFWSNGASEAQIRKAYDIRTQGIFDKAYSYPELKNTILAILQYWNISQHPTQ